MEFAPQRLAAIARDVNPVSVRDDGLLLQAGSAA